MTPTPPHRHPIRVYYEDTDAGGVMYHAAHVRFFERARSEWLRAAGLSQRELATQVLFAVKQLTVTYHRPALLDDWLCVESAVAAAGNSRLDFHQRLLRPAAGAVLPEELATAQVQIVCVSPPPFRPIPIPPPLRPHLASPPSSRNS